MLRKVYFFAYLFMGYDFTVMPIKYGATRMMHAFWSKLILNTALLLFMNLNVENLDTHS